MSQKRRNAISSLIVILFGLALFYAETDGFRAYTAETARIIRLNGEKPEFPKAVLEDSEGRTYTISEFEGKFVFLTFIYTSCGTVCPQLEMNMTEIYDSLPSEYIGEDIVFLSLSFDPARDGVAALREYKHHFKPGDDAWRYARIPDHAELDDVLKKYGVIVLPDGKGDFMHNAAFYLVDRQGRLAEVMDDNEIQEAADKIERAIESGKGA
jgi:protein SCO1